MNEDDNQPDPAQGLYHLSTDFVQARKDIRVLVSILTADLALRH